MKNLILLIVLVGIAFGGYTAWQRWGKKSADSDASQRPKVATAERRNISFSVNAAGEIGPAEQVSVRPEINGRIELLPVDLGDVVSKGSLLFKLDDKELQQQRSSSLTDIVGARLSLEKAGRDYQRAQQLLADNLISQELYDDTKTTYELAKVAVERSQRDLALIEERLTKTVVSAPFDCTILTRPISNGQAVSGSGGFNSGTEVMTIADLNSLIINAHVNQADVPRLKLNQEVEISVEAVAGLKVSGIVERIAPQATIKNNIKGFAARIVLKNVDPRVRPGMTANIKIPVGSAENVTAVPLAAVFTERNPETGEMERFAYVATETDWEKRSVKVGLSDFFFAEIQDGLSEGEVVALELPKEHLDRERESADSGKLAGRGGPNGTNAAPSAGAPGSTGPGNAPGSRTAGTPRT